VFGESRAGAAKYDANVILRSFSREQQDSPLFARPDMVIAMESGREHWRATSIYHARMASERF